MAASQPGATGSIDLFGVNLAGAEFGAVGPGDQVGTSHFYPTESELAYYAAKGFDVIRLPFKWERLQPVAGGALDATELAYVDAVVDWAERAGIAVIFDPHDYGHGYGSPIGSDATPVAAFTDLWGRLAAHFADDPNVIFGLMNEPTQSAAEWLGIANAAIAAIREAGAAQRILVPGAYHDGAWTWTATDNAEVLGDGVVDPLDNFAFEVHQYLDFDGSGTHFEVVSETVGAERLLDATAWAERTGHQLFLTEFGVAEDATSLVALRNMLDHMAQHPDAWIGATYWAGGGHWGSYPMAVEPVAGADGRLVDRPQMAVLDDYVSPDPVPYWNVVAPPPPPPPQAPPPAPSPVPEVTSPGTRPAPFVPPISVAEADALAFAPRRDVDFLPRDGGGVLLARADGQFRDLGEVPYVSLADGRHVFDLADPAAQVFRLYGAALGRAPEQAGLNHGIAVLGAGVPLDGLAAGMLSSPEAGARLGAGLGGDAFIARLYDNVLGRAPSAGELGYYRGVLEGGVTRAQVLAGFSESPEHVARTAGLLAGGLWDVSEEAATVARLYDTMLGRLPDLEGLRFYRGQLEEGSASLASVVAGFENSPEFIARYGAAPGPHALVGLLYENALGRAGSAEEQAYYAAQLSRGWTRKDLVLAFSESPEHVALTRDNVASDDPGCYGIAFA